MFIKSLVIASLASLALASGPACTAEPAGSGPAITPDTAAAFVASSELGQTALDAATPDCYLQAFANKQGLPTNSYLVETYSMSSYDPVACAQYCTDTLGCTGINMYFSRDPSIVPGEGCENPPSTTGIKCATYGSTIALFGGSVAYNEDVGPQDADSQAFTAVVAGSNGWNYNC